ncbi:MAG: phosphoribosylanthranilate isomerase [Chitinophagaceae bacterium]
MKVKVCGLTQKAQVEVLEKMGVHYAGFIFYPQSPRYVLNATAKDEIKSIGGNIQKVGVFVNEPLESLIDMIDACGLDIVQLHGDESPEYCRQVAQKTTIIKAFQVKSQSGIQEKVAQYKDVVDLFLLDTPSTAYGGTGEKFDWNDIAQLEIGKPFFLSGGISHKDVAILEKFNRFPIAKDLHAIDVNSCFETVPGIKDLRMLEDFFKQLNIWNDAE